MDAENRAVMKQMANLLGVSFQTLFIRLRQFGMIEYHPIEELLVNQIRDEEVSAL